MKIKAFKVMGTKYSVKAVEGLLSSEHVYGRCDKSKKQITYDSSLSGSQLKLTLIHELAHAICHEAAVDQAIHWSLEEVLCEQMSRAIVGNLKLG